MPGSDKAAAACSINVDVIECCRHAMSWRMVLSEHPAMHVWRVVYTWQWSPGWHNHCDVSRFSSCKTMYQRDRFRPSCSAATVRMYVTTGYYQGVL